MLLRIGFVSALALLLTALTASAFTFEISFVPERVKQGKRASFTIELVGAPHEPIFKSQLNGIELMLADLRTGKRHILPIEPIVEFRKRSVKDVGLPVATHFRGGKDVVGQLNESGRYTFDGTFEVAKDLEPGLYRFIVWFERLRGVEANGPVTVLDKNDPTPLYFHAPKCKAWVATGQCEKRTAHIRNAATDAMLVGRADEVVYRYLTATRDMSREGKGAVIGYATIVGFPYGRVAHSNYKQFRETSTLTRQWILEHIQFGDMLLQDLRFMTDAKVMPRVDLAALKETLQRYHVSTAWIERKMNRGQPPVQVVQQQQQPMAPYMPAWQQQRQPMAPSMPGWQQQQQPQIGIPIYGQPPVGMGMPYNTPMFAPAAQPAQPWQGYPPPPAAYAPYARPPMQ